MQKIIHYCWFGGKPLPKLAKKCIKSWKKYLPNFEIKEWNENNFDVTLTKFSIQAYEQEKWAFVSDVARIYALKNYGGIYLDTDMLITKNIDFLIDDEVFLGWESEDSVACGVLGVKEKDNEFINKIWQFYCKTDFDKDDMFLLSIPNIMTDILNKEYDMKPFYMENQSLFAGIKVYARDYFYPISSSSLEPNMFTNRTCMVHYYVGSWVSQDQKKRIKFQMIFGPKCGLAILNFLVKCKRVLKSVAKTVLYPLILYRRKSNNNKRTTNEINHIREQFQTIDGKGKYVVFCNRNWLGTGNATRELFNNVIGLDEIFDDRIIDVIVKEIVDRKIKLVVFSAFAFGWEKLVKKINDVHHNITIKVIWHGGVAMNVEYYDWTMFNNIFDLLNKNLIKSIAFVKKSMYEFYLQKGYNVELVLNTVHIGEDYKIEKKGNDKHVKIGLYASGDRWVKNFYNQLAAASKFEYSRIDCVPMTEKAIKMAKIFKTRISGVTELISREALLKRMARNDINFYVTFTECAPLIPLESLELGVPCITSHNHHYWDGTKLEKYLIVDENDDVSKIYEKAKNCLENKDEILKIYKKWKIEYDKDSKESVEKFLNN